MNEGTNGIARSPSRRELIRTALSAALVAAVPQMTVAKEKAPTNRRPPGFEKLDTILPSEQLKWFADKLGPEGGLWPMLRDGDFTDDELKIVLRSLASVSRALNNPSSEDLKDYELSQMRNSIPSLDDIPHLYTIAMRAKDGKWHDFGNVQVYVYKGKPYIQSSGHVIEGVAKYAPEISKYFHATPEKNGRPVDVTFAPLAKVPVFDDHDTIAVEMPEDLDTRTCHGQINVVMGYKDDGGALSIAGIVLPTPDKMRERLDLFWSTNSGDTLDALKVVQKQKEGGLFLMPSFLGQLEPDKTRVRAAGRSGSFRLVRSPRHGYFVPASNFSSGASLVDETTGMFRGWVDSMTHVTRGLKDISEKLLRTSLPTILPRHVPTLESGTFEIMQGVYLRSVHRRRSRGPATPSSATHVQRVRGL